MALKKIIDVGIDFPKKAARLGAPPPPADILDNVGELTRPEPAIVAVPEPVRTPQVEQVTPPKPAAKTTPAHDGRGVHTGKGIDARQQIRTGRNYQFGARTTVAFADEVKRLAMAKKITIGELLEEMLDAYRT